jgi:hypothetical protein
LIGVFCDTKDPCSLTQHLPGLHYWHQQNYESDGYIKPFSF